MSATLRVWTEGEVLELGGGLDPFADRREAELPGQRNDGRRDDGRRSLLLEVHDEGAVDLDDVDGQAREIAQR